MTINELRPTLKAQPCAAFVLHTADERSLPVPHPDFLFVTVGGRTVIVNSTQNESFAIGAPLSVTRLEVPAGGIAAPAPESTQKP